MLKLVVSDLDGTLLNPKHKLTANTIATVQSLVNSGVPFMLATGRHYQDVYLLAKQLQVPMYLITSNGARVHKACGTLLYEDHIPEPLVAKVLALSEGFDIHRNLYQQDLWLVEEPHAELLALHAESGFEYQQTDFGRLALQHIDKIYFTADHAVLVPLEQRLRAQLGTQLMITFTSPEYLEVMNGGVSKGHALAELLALKGIKPADVMVLGDGMNDKEMLALVGHPVIMDNAAPAVKALFPNAPIARSNAEDGVAHYLTEYLNLRL